MNIPAFKAIENTNRWNFYKMDNSEGKAFRVPVAEAVNGE